MLEARARISDGGTFTVFHNARGEIDCPEAASHCFAEGEL
jgi:hypothetical protein